MSDIGGKNTFTQHFKDHLKRSNNIPYQLYIAGNKKPIGNHDLTICRIDGVYFHKFCDYRKINQVMNNTLFNKVILSNYYKSDGIIFQSYFSKQCFVQLFNIKGNLKNHAIIYNGCDTNYFYHKYRQSGEYLKIVSVSVDYPIKRLHYFSRLSQQLETLNIKHSIEIITAKPNIKHQIAKRFKRIDEYIRDKETIKIIYNLTREQVASRLQNADVYISFSHIDPCPNAVIEAMSTGLPVIAPLSGGICEIALPELLYRKTLNEDLFFDWFHYEEICDDEISRVLDKIIKFLNNKDFYFRRSHEHGKKYSLNLMFDKYSKFVESLSC